MWFANLKTRQKILLGSMAPFIGIVALGALSIVNVNSILSINEVVSEYEEQILSGNQVIRYALDMETGMRGYLLSGKDEFLEPYSRGSDETFSALAILRDRVSDQPSQAESLELAWNTIRKWQSQIAVPYISLRREIGQAASMEQLADQVSQAQGKTYFDAFRAQINAAESIVLSQVQDRELEFVHAGRELQRSIATVNSTSNWVDHTLRAIAEADALLLNIVDMETGLRGFLLTGNIEFLEPFDRGLKEFEDNARSLAKRVSDNPAQVVRVEAIQSTISDWLNVKAKPAKQLRAEVTTGISPSGDIAAFVSENRGRALIDQVRRLIADFKETESRLLDQRQNESTNAKATAEANFTFQTESEATRKLSQQLLIELAEIRINALDMETGMRGYLLAGKSPFLAPYESGRVRFDQSVARALELAEDDEALTAFLLAAQSTIREWTDQVVSPSIALRGDIEGASSMEDLAALIAQAQGKQFFDQFRDAMSKFEQAAGKRIQSAKNQSAQIRHDTFLWVSVCLVVSLLVSLGTLLSVGRLISAPLVATTDAIGKLAAGDLDVVVSGGGRRDEVGKLAAAFNLLAKELGEARRKLQGYTENLEAEIAKRTEELRTKESQLRIALENMPSGIMVTNKDMNIELFNDKYVDLYELPNGVIKVGGSLHDMIRVRAERGDYGAGDPEVLYLDRLGGYGQSGQERVENTVPSGRTLETIRNRMENGTLVATCTDITERKQAETTLQRTYHQISSSIDYASRIQRSILPGSDSLEEAIGDNFVIWEPRDVVGGDVYWCHEWGHGSLIILGDCTGHGVPGAFMTLISTGALERSMAEVEPGNLSGLVSRMHSFLRKSLGQESENDEFVDDGLELGACFVEADRGQLTFVGAHLDLLVIEQGEVRQIKGGRKGIGYREVGHDHVFEETVIEVSDSSRFYMVTDGIVDQISEETGKRFGKTKLKDLLLAVHDQPFDQQPDLILNAVKSHQGDAPRLDDVAVVGFALGRV